MADVKRKIFRLPGWPALVIALSVLLIITAPALAWWQMNRNPILHVPTPALPSPNAFNYYVQAASALPYVDKYYGFYVSTPSKGSNYDPTTFPTMNPTQRASLLALHSEVTRLFRQGTQYPCLAPPIRSFAAHRPYYAKFRNMARYYDVLSRLSAEQGDWDDAMEDSQISMRVGADISHGSDVMGALLGMGCASIGRKLAWDTVNHLSPSEARKALAVMEQIDAREMPFSQTLQEEKWCGEASLMDIFRFSNWREQFVQEVCSDETVQDKKALRLNLVFVNKRRSLARYAAYLDRCIAMAQGPFARRTPGDPPLPDDVICATCAPVCEIAWFKSLQNETGNRLLTVELALRAFECERGIYPTSLAELVSAGDLHTLPGDPFAVSGTFRYARRGTQYVLYSLGPDGINDGGTPIKETTENRMTKDSKGDIVAGVNRF